MMDNMVWVLVDLPPGCKTVRSKWLFKKKTNMDGIVHVYKARLVAKDYTQLYGVDYKETFSPVADIKAIRILISIAAYYDYEIWQMDVKTAFLNCYLDEDIYMVQPEGFVDPNHPRKKSGYIELQKDAPWKLFGLGSLSQGLDKVCWRLHDGQMKMFSVRVAWDSIRTRCDKVPWFHVVWFSACVPCHAFDLWLVMGQKLQTRDKLKQWDVENNFQTTKMADMLRILPTWDEAMDWLLPISKGNSVTSIVGPLILAASSYFVWQERNNRQDEGCLEDPECEVE
ncbi:retrotransposon protein, putative, ty1-copia subclass, partial [Tanacetum coccineum]